MAKSDKPQSQCVGCKFASWHTTSNGRLHPSGDGRCTWTMPDIVLPISYSYNGWGNPSREIPRPSGGYINRAPDGKNLICATRRANT